VQREDYEVDAKTAEELAALRQHTRNAFARGQSAATRRGAILNDGLGLTAIMNLMGGNVRRAFIHPRLVRLPTGMRLYRFNSESPMRPTGDFFSGWWSPTEAYQHDPGLAQRRQMARHFGVSLREYARVTSAISEPWGTLEFLIHASLTRPAYAAFGGFAAQARGNSANRDAAVEGRGASAKLPGGGTQFYIPYLTAADLEFAPRPERA
jgi:hypothetical protein